MEDRFSSSTGSSDIDDPAAHPGTTADAAAAEIPHLEPVSLAGHDESVAPPPLADVVDDVGSRAVSGAVSCSSDGDDALGKVDGVLTLTIMLAAVTSIGPFALQVVAPGLPAFARALDVSNSAAQLIVTLAIFAMAAGAVVYGPLSDRFGRRPVLLGALWLAVVGSAIAAFAPSFEVILLGRVLQSLGTGAGMVLARAVARDMFGVSGSAAMIARITGFMVVAPMVAPTIGGLVIEYIGWRGVFGAIGVFSAVLLVWAQARFQESLQNPSESLGFASVFRDYARILGKRAFVAYCSYTALSIGTFFLFIGAAPYLMEQRYGLTPAEYGLLFIGVSLAFMTANFYSARAAARFGARNVVLYAPLFSVGWSLVVAALLAAGVGGVGYLGAVLAVAVCIGNAVSAGLATPQAVAGAVNTSPDRAGSASGLIAVVQFGTAGVVAQLSTLLSPTSAIALPIGMAALAAGSTLAFWALGKGEE